MWNNRVRPSRLAAVFGPQVPSVTPGELTTDAYLLDVREPEEWTAGHAPGAHHLPMMEVPARMAEIPADGDVVVVCRSGNRSGKVVRYLMDNGWDNLRNLTGGMLQWAAEGRPVTAENGQTGHVI